MRSLYISSLIFLTLSLSARAADPCERQLLPSVAVDVSLRFLSETINVDLAMMGDFWSKDYAPFRQWLSENRIAWDQLPTGKKYAVMAEFFAPKLGAYDERLLEDRRSQQLAEELIHRGATKLGHETGYALLERLSLKNYETLIGIFQARVIDKNAKPASEETLREIEGAVRNLSIAFIHNTTQLQQRPTLPLLSAKELFAMGITNKLNTQTFNREILKTHGNVYFFAIPYSRRGPQPATTSQYGGVRLALTEGFAQRWGWMSPFVMYPQELAELAQNTMNTSLEPKTADADQWKPIVKNLHRFDMRPSEYILFLQESLNLTLAQLSYTNPSEYKRILSALDGGDDLPEIVDRYCLQPMGLKSKTDSRTLELKIPVAVPPQVLELRLDPKADYPSPLMPKGPLLRGRDPLF